MTIAGDASTSAEAVPTPEQQAAIGHPLSPLLIVAGAGTGKTFVMSRRIVHAVRTMGVAPHEILALTFTNKAAANLEAQVREALGADTDVTVGTYHSFGAGLVADHHIELGLAPDTRVLNRAQAWMLVYSVFDDFRFRERSSLSPGFLVNDALALASRLADHLIPIDDLEADCDRLAETGRWAKMRESAGKRRDLCQIIRAYDERKQRRGYIDFADQIRLAVELVDANPAIAADIRRQHPVLLLDEYQDTNYAQRVLLQRIWGDGEAPAAITAVGDDMQSIYAFRGAHLANLVEFPDHFPPCHSTRLEVNRRSGQSVVELGNRIQAMIPTALPKTLAPLDGAEPTSIECFVAADDHAEATHIARRIAETGEPWGDTAILVRKRKLIPALVDALEAAGIPVEEVGGGGLMVRPEIVDLVSWLEVLAEPRASVALLRILEGPRYRLGRSDLGSLARHARELDARARAAADDTGEDRPSAATLLDAVRDHRSVDELSPAARSRLAAFERDRATLASLAARLPVVDLCESIARRAGLWDHPVERVRENLLRFFDLAAEFAPVDGVDGLVAFIEYLRLVEESEEAVAEARMTDRDAVKVMTVHQAKGLEFDTVFVAGLAGGQGRGGSVFPDNRLTENPVTNNVALPYWLRHDAATFPDPATVGKMDDIGDFLKERQLEEEWRLLYVACTRAERTLVCSTAHWYPGPSEPQGPSQFYDFIAEQADLATERFREDPAEDDPASAARERQRGAAVDPPAAVTDDAPDARPGLFEVVPATPPTPLPTSLSVTDLVGLHRCARQFFWTTVRPLPRRWSPAARVGTEVHRRIEADADRQLTLLDPRDVAQAPGEDDGAGGGGPDVLQGYLASYRRSPFADLDPVGVEVPFELVLDGVVIRGRIDAIYERDGFVELVDFKTGRGPVGDDPARWTQVSVYSLAAARLLGHDPGRLRSTYCRLRVDDDPVVESIQWDAPGLAALADDLAARCAGLADQPFDTNPGAWCGACPFAAVCPDAAR